MKKKSQICIYVIIVILTLLTIDLFMTGCCSIPVSANPKEEIQKVAVPAAHIALSWENTTAPHPERAPWSDALLGFIDAKFNTFDKAKDINKFCPKYSTLNHNQKLTVWGELFVALAYYESGYDPKSTSVDVGHKEDKNTWSVGLLQMSYTDIKNYSFKMNYKFEDLLKAEPNLDLGTAVMARQIEKVGTVLIGPSRASLYWATLHPTGKYDKSSSIIARVQKNTKVCQ